MCVCACANVNPGDLIRQLYPGALVRLRASGRQCRGAGWARGAVAAEAAGPGKTWSWGAEPVPWLGHPGDLMVIYWGLMGLYSDLLGI